MITATGYSKDPTLVPEGIVVTFGKKMIDEQGGLKTFLSNFERVMANPDDYWMHKCKNMPTIEVDHVYIIVANRLYGRVFWGGFERGPATGLTADGRYTKFAWARIILAGPLERSPNKRVLKGFQGFRYCTRLF